MIRKRTGGYREIFHPARELKALQLFLLREIAEKFPVHEAAYAYRRGRQNGISNNAERHAHSAFLLRVDFQDFFPSITKDDLNAFLTGTAHRIWPWWSNEDTELFCAVVCRKGVLTIGAPTSPALSNVLCVGLDQAMLAKAIGYCANYTRYADDLFFSCNAPNVLRQIEAEIASILGSLPWPKNLRLNPSKTFHLSKKRRRVVTGMVLKSEGGTSIGRKLKRQISSMIHQLEGLGGEKRLTLAGLLSFAQDVEPDFINRMVLKYGPTRVVRARRPGDQ